MTRNQRQLMLLHRSTSGWQTIAGYAELLVSQDARRIRRRYAGVSSIFSRTLGDPDDTVDLVLRPHRIARRNIGLDAPVWKWMVLAAMVAIVVCEYRFYSLPVLREWFNTALRRCGISN